MISIIIPVYNVKLYLDNCIQSVIQQSYTDFECILVDDGSTDGSSEICDQWAEKDNRIIIVHQPMEEYHPLETKDWNKQRENISVLLIAMTG